MDMPDRVSLFIRVGADKPHVGENGETMSWGNSNGASYIKDTPHNITEAYLKLMAKLDAQHQQPNLRN
jgi:hypothetical protein